MRIGGPTICKRLDGLVFVRGGLNMELGQERGECAAAMADGELGLEIDFGHGAIELRQVEEGIVAEAAGAARGVEDHAFDCAVG